MTNEPDDIQNLFNILESHENKLDNLENVIKKDKLMINDLNSFSDEINLLKNELKNIKEINNKTKEYLLLEIESSVDKQNQFNQSNYFGDFVDFLKNDYSTKFDEILLLNKKLGELENSINYKDNRIDSLVSENEDLKVSVENCKGDIDSLRNES